MSGSRRLAVVLAALALLILMAAPLGSAAESGYILRGVLKRVELTDRAPISSERRCMRGSGGPTGSP